MGYCVRSVFSIIFILCLIFLQIFCVNGLNLNKISASSLDYNIDDLSKTNSNEIQNNNDEYPVVVPKRAAILLDRLMVALHHALEDEKDGSRKISDVYGTGKGQIENEKYFDFIQAKYPSTFKNLAEEIEKGRYDVYNEGTNLYNVRDLKSDNDNKKPNENDTSGRSSGRVYWRCYFNAVSCF